MWAKAEAAGWGRADFDVRLSVYIEAGTMTNDERHALLTMTYPERLDWLASKRYPVDAMPMVSLDFDSWGFITPEGLAKFDSRPAHAR
jgi:hypothetical protein